MLDVPDFRKAATPCIVGVRSSGSLKASQRPRPAKVEGSNTKGILTDVVIDLLYGVSLQEVVC